MQLRRGLALLCLFCSAFLPQIIVQTSRASVGAAGGQTNTPTNARVLQQSVASYAPIARAESIVQPLPVPRFTHVFIIVMENKEYDSVIGNPAAPYFNSLAQQYGLATNYYGVTHPSLPNYIALTAGSTYTITTNCEKCFLNVPNIADQIEQVGRTWKAYIESMPQPCFVGSKGSLYKQKHNPFIYYDDIRNNPVRCNRIVPFTEFALDLQNKTLADYTWITPNMCNSEHDCSVAKGDAWLKTWVSQILGSSAWQQGGVLFITYDEGSTSEGCCGGSEGGRVATLVISPLGKPAFQSAAATDHYSLLRTIEAAWSMPPLGKAANAQTLGALFRIIP